MSSDSTLNYTDQNFLHYIAITTIAVCQCHCRDPHTLSYQSSQSLCQRSFDFQPTMIMVTIENLLISYEFIGNIISSDLIFLIFGNGPNVINSISK